MKIDEDVAVHIDKLADKVRLFTLAYHPFPPFSFLEQSHPTFYSSFSHRNIAVLCCAFERREYTYI